MYHSPEDTKRIAITQLQRKSILAPFVINTTIPKLDVSRIKPRVLDRRLKLWTKIAELYPITAYPKIAFAMNQADKTTAEFPTTIIVDIRPGCGETESQRLKKFLLQRRSKEQRDAQIEAKTVLSSILSDAAPDDEIHYVIMEIVELCDVT
jgi:hypothetical protein